MGGRGARVLPFATLGMLGALTCRVDGELVFFSLPVCVGLLTWSWRRAVARPGRTELLGLLAALLVLQAATVYEMQAAVAIITGAIVVLGAALGRRVPPRLAVIGLVLGTLSIGAAGVLDPIDNDVILAHEAAAGRVGEGLSPYRDLGVVESNPANLGAPIEGYSYPPVALGVFGLLGRPLGGADTVTAGLWGLVVLVAIRRYGVRSTTPAAMALLPGLPISVAYGWTEVLTLLLVLAALSLRGDGRAAVLGAAMASKQYLVVAVPSILMAWWRRRRWLLLAAMTAAAVTAPVVVDLSGAYAALVEFHLHRPLRPDSTNLAGFLVNRVGLISWPVPSIVVACLAAAAGAIVTRRHGDAGWLHGMLASLVVALAIGPVALINYWLLVAGLALLVLGEAERSERTSGVISVSKATAPEVSKPVDVAMAP